jgi:hypothetical protein
MPSRVTVTFLLDEEVTPDLFAERVALACAKEYAIRPGEGVELSDGRHLVATDQPVDLPDFLAHRRLDTRS